MLCVCVLFLFSLHPSFLVLQGYHPLTQSTPKFYNWKGDIIPEAFEALGIPSSIHHIVGYFKFRRQTLNQVSLREAAMFRALRFFLSEKGADAANLCLGIICATASNPTLETHTYDYSFWTVGTGSDEYAYKVIYDNSICGISDFNFFSKAAGEGLRSCN